MLDVPPRHRSLQAVFESSWALLNEQEARALACCSVFRRGFTAEAAYVIADVTTDELATLVDTSLLYVGDCDRYEMHSFIREAAARKLAEMGALQDQVRSRYRAYYADLVAQHQPRFASDRRAVQMCTREASNLITTWNMALEMGEEATLAKMIRGMSQLISLNGALAEGVNAFSRAASELRKAGMRRGEEPSPVLGQLLLEQSFLLEQMGRTSEAAQVAQEALAIGERRG